MSERGLVAFLGFCVAAAVIALICATAYYHISTNTKMENAIKTGSNPIDAYCAFNGGSENKVCLLRAASRGETK